MVDNCFVSDQRLVFDVLVLVQLEDLGDLLRDEEPMDLVQAEEKDVVLLALVVKLG